MSWISSPEAWVALATLTADGVFAVRQGSGHSRLGTVAGSTV